MDHTSNSELTRKMGKKSKKKKRCKMSSSSSEQDETESQGQEHDNCKSVKKMQDVKSHKSHAKEWERSVSSTIKDDTESSRQIKQPVYRLAKTQRTEQKPINKQEQCRKTKCISVPLHGEICSSKAKKNILGKDKTCSGSKAVETGLSKMLNTNKAGTVPQRTDRTSKRRLDEGSSQRDPSKLKKQLMSPSLVSTEREEQRQVVRQMRCKAEVQPRSGNDSSPVKTRKHAYSFSQDSLQQKGKELVKKRGCQEKKFATRRNLWTDEKHSSASSTKISSTTAKHTTSESSSEVSRRVNSVPGSVISVSHKTAPFSSTHKQIPSVPLNFKIPKKVKLHAEDIKSSQLCGAASTKPHPRVGHQHSPQSSGLCEEESEGRSPLTASKIQVAEELTLARSEKRPEVNVSQSYGELTSMDIDSPEEEPADTLCRQPPQQSPILVLDTNILLSHLDYVKMISSHGLKGLGFPVVLIPWVVLQELDSLKKGRDSVTRLVIPAISFIHNSLKSRKPHLWGQSMQQATQSSYGLNAENNDDRVLQCCLQYQTLYPECALILCTDDKNLCSKALLSGVKAFTKKDFEAEVERSGDGLHMRQSIQAPMPPHINPQVSSPVPSRSSTSVRSPCQELLSRCVSALEECLRDVLSDVLEVEMKAVYDELWLEIVCIKPPWTLRDVLQCLKKHWIAVFGQIVSRTKVETVSYLITFFNSGEKADCSRTTAALQEAKELVKAFSRSSRQVPHAISVMDSILKKLQPELPGSVEGDSSVCDVVMNDDDEDKQPTAAQVSHQEVWAMFESIWSNVYQTSLEVFKALGFDPHTMQSAQPVGGPVPPQDALACLHKLSSTVSQLLQAFSSVLSSAPELEEVQTLLSIIQSSKIVNVDSRLTAEDLLDCFSQPDYREKLRVGGSQLMELREALDRCIQATSQPITFSM